MKVAVIGSRKFRRLQLVHDYIKSLDKSTIIVTGGAIGIDREAIRICKKYGLEYLVYLPNYAKFGKKAPLLRNYTICQESDWMICFWDGVSRGSKHAMDYMKSLNKSVILIRDIEPEPMCKCA